MTIDEIINITYHTDKGYKYLVDLIKNKYPALKINEENLKSLKIENMSKEDFIRTGFVGIYIAHDNTIKVFTNKDEIGNNIFDYNLTFNEIINTFLHELIHALTSRICDDRRIIEGINIRLPDGNNSFFLGINEGITQMITDNILNEESDAYPFETNFARQLAFIIGEDKLLSIYASNNPQLLIDAINEVGLENNALDLIKEIFLFDLVYKNQIEYADYNLGISIQSRLIELYINSGLSKDKDFRKIILNNKKVEKFLTYFPYQKSIEEIGFEGIDQLFESFERREKNGKKI